MSTSARPTQRLGASQTVRLQEVSSGPTSRSSRRGHRSPQSEQLAAFSFSVDLCAGCAIMDLAMELDLHGPGLGVSSAPPGPLLFALLFALAAAFAVFLRHKAEGEY